LKQPGDLAASGIALNHRCGVSSLKVAGFGLAGFTSEKMNAREIAACSVITSVNFADCSWMTRYSEVVLDALARTILQGAEGRRSCLTV
jgi:hypothetical protein